MFFCYRCRDPYGDLAPCRLYRCHYSLRLPFALPLAFPLALSLLSLSLSDRNRCRCCYRCIDHDDYLIVFVI